MSEDPNKRQVGGAHYSAEIQHWDIVEAFGVGYLEGCATKYVTRWRKKNGLEDLRKALHYTEKLLELARKGLPEYGDQEFRQPRGRVPELHINRFLASNDVSDTEERLFIALLLSWKGPHHLSEAAYRLKRFIERQEWEQANPPQLKG